MRRPVEIAILGVVLVGSVLGSCGPQRRDALVGRPASPDNPDEVRGERLFFRHCSLCHPNGEAGLGPALNDKPLPEVAVEQQIRRGVGAMPAFSDRQLTDAEVEEIADYVSDLRGTPERPTRAARR